MKILIIIGLLMVSCSGQPPCLTPQLGNYGTG